MDKPSVEGSWKQRLQGAVAPRLHHLFRAYRERRVGEAELRLLPFLVDPRRNAVDIGANKGVYTYWLARLARHVHAYEPNPRIFRILAAGTRGDPKVTTHDTALSDRQGTATLLVPIGKRGLSSQGGSLIRLPIDKEMFPVPVVTRRLDDEGLTDVGFIKIDVEGTEFAVLDGARETIARDRPVLLIEMEQRHTGQPILEAVARVAELGYHALAVIDGVLQGAERLDIPRHHMGCKDPKDYVNNFIFLPRGRRS